jgi:hypothetical protein
MRKSSSHLKTIAMAVIKQVIICKGWWPHACVCECNTKVNNIYMWDVHLLLSRPKLKSGS